MLSGRPIPPCHHVEFPLPFIFISVDKRLEKSLDPTGPLPRRRLGRPPRAPRAEARLARAPPLHRALRALPPRLDARLESPPARVRLGVQTARKVCVRVPRHSAGVVRRGPEPKEARAKEAGLQRAAGARQERRRDERGARTTAAGRASAGGRSVAAS